MNPILLLDMDGTINDFDATFIKTLYEMGYDFDMQHYNTWNMEDFIIGADDPSKVMNEICTDLSFWKKIKPLPYAADILKDMTDRYEIRVVTNPWINDDWRYRKVKVDWLREYFGFLRKNEIIFTGDKWELEGDIIFDDKPKILKKCIDTMITVKVNHPYNTDVESDFSFDNWKQVPSIMKTIDKFFKKGK